MPIPTTSSSSEMSFSEIFPFATNIEFGNHHSTSIIKDRFDRCDSFGSSGSMVRSSGADSRSYEEFTSCEKSDLLGEKSDIGNCNPSWGQGGYIRGGLLEYRTVV